MSTHDQPNSFIADKITALMEGEGCLDGVSKDRAARYTAIVSLMYWLGMDVQQAARFTYLTDVCDKGKEEGRAFIWTEKYNKNAQKYNRVKIFIDESEQWDVLNYIKSHLPKNEPLIDCIATKNRGLYEFVKNNGFSLKQVRAAHLQRVSEEEDETKAVQPKLTAQQRIDLLSNKKKKKAQKIYSQLHLLLRQHGKRHLVKNKRISDRTYTLRYVFIKLCVADLADINYKEKTIEKIKRKHCIALCRYWEKKYQGSTNIPNLKTHLRTILSWVGREKLLDDIQRSELFENPAVLHRPIRTRTNKSMSAGLRKLRRSGVDIEPNPWEYIQQLWPTIDGLKPMQKRKAGLYITMLEVMSMFGLRSREAAFFRPKNDSFINDGQRSKLLKEEYANVVKKGAKGGRPRTVSIRSAEQRNYLKELKARDHYQMRIMPGHVTKTNTWLRGFNRFCESHHLSRDLGTNPNRLRHEFAQTSYESRSGLISPIKAEGKVKVDQDAKELVANDLGHNRPSITGAYIG